MGRAILLILIVMAAIAVLATLRTTPASHDRETDVPKTVQTVSYVLLIIFMFGVVTGWLGGL